MDFRNKLERLKAPLKKMFGPCQKSKLAWNLCQKCFRSFGKKKLNQNYLLKFVNFLFGQNSKRFGQNLWKVLWYLFKVFGEHFK